MALKERQQVPSLGFALYQGTTLSLAVTGPKIAPGFSVCVRIPLKPKNSEKPKGAPQIPPLRYAPVGMTIHLGNET
jgi:hypothetical protein